MRLFTILSVVGGVLSGCGVIACGSSVRGHRHAALSRRGSLTPNRGTERPVRSNPSRLQHKSSDGATKRSLPQELRHRAMDVESGTPTDKIEVDLYWHVIHKGSTVQDGYISTATIQKQIAIVNSIFTDSGLPMSINLAHISYINNPLWFEHGGDYDTAPQREVIKNLRAGGAADVNVITVRKPRDGPYAIMGYGTLPQNFEDFSYLDAIFLAFDSMPGSSSEGGEVLQGKALAHELGHYLLGLEHTFEGGCSPTNDGIADTPPQRFQTQGCTYNAAAECEAGIPYVTHSDDPNETVWFNLMDYSNEACRGGLTPDQVAAGLRNWYLYRAHNTSTKG